MGEVQVKRVIEASREDVWRALSDIGGIYRFHPLVQRSPLLTEQTGGVGAERMCEFHDGNHISERVVDWVDGRSLAVKIYEGTMPLKRATARFTLEAAGAGRTEVDFTMSYEPKFGVIGRAMDAMVMRRKFKSILAQVLAGLDTYVRTGEEVGADGASMTPAEAAA